MTTSDGVRVRQRRALLDADDALLRVYVAVIVLGAITSAVVGGAAFGVGSLGDHRLEAAVLLAILVWSEAKPITVIRAAGVDHVVASTTFAFTIFLTFGPVPAMVAQGGASLVADLVARRPTIKVLFNVAQYVVAWAVAGAAAAALGAALGIGVPGTRDDLFAGAWYVMVAVAGLTYFAVNNLLVGIAVGLSAGRRVVPAVRSTIVTEWSTDLLLLAIAPIVVIVVDTSLVVLPLLALPVIAIYRSVSLAAEKQYLALHDPLTGLPNRLQMTSTLATLVDHADPGRRTAVMLIDLDRFKEVNDTLGHEAGDELLRMVGPRLEGVLPVGSTVGRLGGDEFAVLVPSLADDEAAFAVAEAIGTTLGVPFVLEGFNLVVDASIGIAIHPDDGRDVDELLKCADIAMYLAKARGTAYERYDQAHDPHSTRRLELVGDLRSAIADGEIGLLYQPKLALDDHRVRSVEALVRWVHPRYGVIQPSEFVPLAEHTGLIRALTTHVLGAAARQIASWRAVGIDLSVAVNVSVRSLHDDSLVEEIEQLLAGAGVPPASMRLEITEGSIMADPERTRRLLERLAAMGVGLSIDDFGTGYSSLAYLKDLPVDEIKIDRSFVTHLLTSDGDRAIVGTIIDLARHLDLATVAEGVEDGGSMHWLAVAGCHSAQGYHVGRPMTGAELVDWLRAEQRV